MKGHTEVPPKQKFERQSGEGVSLAKCAPRVDDTMRRKPRNYIGSWPWMLAGMVGILEFRTDYKGHIWGHIKVNEFIKRSLN